MSIQRAEFNTAIRGATLLHALRFEQDLKPVLRQTEKTAGAEDYGPLAILGKKDVAAIYEPDGTTVRVTGILGSRDVVDTALATEFFKQVRSLDVLDIKALGEITKSKDEAKAFFNSLEAVLKAEREKLDTDGTKNNAFIKLFDSSHAIAPPYQASLKELSEAYAEFHKTNLLLSDLISHAKNLGANESAFMDLQSSFVQIIEAKDLAERNLLAAIKDVRDQHTKIESYKVKVTKAKELFSKNATLDFARRDSWNKTQNESFVSMEKYARDLGFGSISDATDVKNIKEELVKLEGATTKLGSTVRPTDLSSFMKREINGLEQKESDRNEVKSKWENTTQLRDEVKIHLAKASETVKTTQAEYDRIKAEQISEGDTVKRDQALTKAKKTLEKLFEDTNIGEELPRLLKDLQNIKKIITTKHSVTVPADIDTNSNHAELREAIIEAFNRYNELPGVIATHSLAEDIIELNRSNISALTATTPQDMWTVLSGKESNLTTANTALEKKVSKANETRIANDHAFFETKWNEREKLNAEKQYWEGVRQEVTKLLDLDTLKKVEGDGIIKNLQESLDGLASTQTQGQIDAVRTQVEAIIDYVEKESFQTLDPNSDFSSELLSLKHIAQAIMDKSPTDPVDIDTVNKLIEKISEFHTNSSNEIKDLNLSIDTLSKKITNLDSLIKSNDSLNKARTKLKEAKINETAFKVIEPFLDAIEAAQTPEQFKALEDKVNELEAKLQSTGDTSLQSQIDALKEQIGAKSSDPNAPTGSGNDSNKSLQEQIDALKNNSNGSGMPWYGWALGIASFAVGGFGLFSASQAKQSADDQKKKFETTMAQLDQRLGDLQQLTSISLKNSAVAAQRAGVASKNAQIAQQIAIKTEKRVNQILPFVRKSSKKRTGVGS